MFLRKPVGVKSTAVLFVVTVELLVAGCIVLWVERAAAVDSSELLVHAVAAPKLVIGLVSSAVLS